MCAIAKSTGNNKHYYYARIYETNEICRWRLFKNSITIQQRKMP